MTTDRHAPTYVALRENRPVAIERRRHRRRRSSWLLIAAIVSLVAVLAPTGTAPAAAPPLQVSQTKERANPTALEGATVGGKVYVLVQAQTGITKVEFWLDDPAMAGLPRQTEGKAPWDFAGSAADGTALPFDTKTVTEGQHTITARVTRSSGVQELAHATFTVSNPLPGCSPVPCEQVRVDLPHELEFSRDRAGILDANGIGTGFTWLDWPSNGTGYIPANLAIDGGTGTLNITTTNGLQYKAANSLDNALAVGIRGPNQISYWTTTLVNLPAGTGNNEQAGLWFGNNENNYVKLVVISSSGGTRIQHLMEVGGAEPVKPQNSGGFNPTGASVTLNLKADPELQKVTASYNLNGGPAKTLGSFTVPPEFFSFDAAGIDPRIGTRTFGGIFASHRTGPAPLVYTFDRFEVGDAAPEPPPPPPTNISFNRASFDVPFPTSMVAGPDGRLYVTELFGKIHALTLGPNKEVVNDQIITTLGSRLALGITVDPASTPSNVILYVSHSSPSLDNGVPNSSTVTRLSGPGFTTREDVITGLPRAKANHAINAVEFGPDGRLYIAQGGNTGAGAPNNGNTEFGTMEEQPLSAAMLVANIKAAGFDGSCNNLTDIFGPPPCDVTTYATGLRNAYDFAWHSNGNLYAPDNGLGVTGTFPPSPTAPCLGMGNTSSWQTGGHNPGAQTDLLFRVQQGKYHGHPNPRRNECVFQGGSYQGVAPLPNYAPPIFDLGEHRSADGTIEYTASAFCGDLKGQLLIANFSVGDDVTKISLSSDGNSVTDSRTLVGGFVDPLALTMGADGTIFVAEQGTGRISALTPINLGCWGGKQAMPVATLDAGGAALGGKLYVVGGKTSAGHQSAMRIYEPATDSWTSGPNLPGPAVENPALVPLGGKLYAFGGSTDPFSGAVSNAAVFDPGTGQWTSLTPMPTARGGAAAQAIGGKIYVAGGMLGTGASAATVEVFDPATGSWSPGPPMTTRRDNPGAAVFDGKLYVFGGRTRNADGTTDNPTLASVEMLDPSTGAWLARAPMPTGRRTVVVGTLGGKAQVMGGEIRADGGSFNNNEEYDPVTDTWRTLRTMQTGRHGAAAGTIGDTVYVVGGGPTGGLAFTAVNEAFSFGQP